MSIKKSKIIIQSDSNDKSTDDVITWIKYLSDKKILVFFDDYKINDFEIVMNSTNSYIKINESKIDINDSFWYRRGFFQYYSKKSNLLFQNLYNNIYSQNEKTLLNTINSSDFFRNSINCYKDNNIEKSYMLFLCKKIGIQIPNMLITNDREKALIFIKKHKKVITKALRFAATLFHYKEKRIQFSSRTILIDEAIFNKFKKKFTLSLFQEYVEKKYEIRTFYIKGVFKSMAIFSQANEKTKIDFRNYDYENPNRLVPYQLPLEIEIKLKKLMDELKLNSGSIDIIYTPKGEYYFLEINPVGQFQWLSRHCNYNIEKLIAQELCK